MTTTFAVPLTMDDIKLFERHALNTLRQKPLDLMAGQTLRLTTHISDQAACIADLLAALRDAVQCHGPFGDDSRPAWWQAAVAAIAKAEGRS